MVLLIDLDSVDNGFGSITYVSMTVDGKPKSCPVGQNADSWLKSNVANYDWYQLNGEEWVKLTDTDVFPTTRTVYSKIPGMSLGTMGWMQDISDKWIALVGDTLGVFNSSAQWYVGDQKVAGQNEGWRVSYTVTEADIGKDAVAKLTDGYATIQSPTIRIVEPLSVTVPAAVAVDETIEPVFNWQLQNNPTTGMTYQWSRDNSPIEGATSCTYTTTQADIEHKLTLKIFVNGKPYYTTDEVAVAANAVTITGVSAATELKYNGAEQTGYTGTPTSAYTGEYDITYTGRNGTVYNSPTPPTNAGDYTVTFAVPADNTTYVGKTSLDFSIAKATITIQADNKTAYVGDTAPEMTYTVTGLVSGETLKTEPTLAYETEPDMTKAGTTAIKVNGAEAPEGGNYDIAYVDGTLTVSTRPSTGGSSGGSSSNTTTKTEKNPDGSTTTTVTDQKTGTVTETTKNTDGSTTVVETKKDGTVTETNKSADGTTGIVVTDQHGDVTDVSASVSNKAAKEAAETGEAVTLPVEVPAAKTTEDAPAVEVTVPKSAGAVKVEIPVEKVTPGTVAVIVHADGTEEIVTTSIPTENGVVLTLDGSATVKIVDNAKEFEDVHSVDHWAEDAVDFVVARGMFTGTSETTFSPNSYMTRAMLMTVLARFDGEDTSGGSVWYEKGMAWAVKNGVSDGSNPNGNITREQLAVMLWRYAGSPTSDHSLDGYTDADQISGYALEAMRWANETGMITGYGNGLLGAKDNATRAQVAQMLMNFVKNLSR